MSAPSSTSSRRTTRPCGPVWWVASVMPSIFEASSRTSSAERASFTPPPLPRPPAWICAFTTQILPPSFFAASTASSTENAGKPRGVATPYLRKSSLPWYSWMFMAWEARARTGLPRFDGKENFNRGPPGQNLDLGQVLLVVLALAHRLDRLGAAIPLRIVLRDRRLGGLERVAAVELEGLLRRILQALAGHGLEGSGGKRDGELRDVRAAAHAAEELLQLLLVAGTDRETHELAVRGNDRVAIVDVGHRIHRRRGIHDGKRPVHRDPQPHRMDRLASGADARGEPEVVRLGVEEVALDVVQAVGALVPLDLDRAPVQGLALARGRGTSRRGVRHTVKRRHWPLSSSPPRAPRGSPRRIPPPSGSALSRNPWRAPSR